MATCGYSTHVQGPCGAAPSNPANLECFLLEDCDKEIKGHLRSFGVSDSYLRSESQLLLARAGKDDMNCTIHCPKLRNVI
jgi:hypothetical protein